MKIRIANIYYLNYIVILLSYNFSISSSSPIESQLSLYNSSDHVTLLDVDSLNSGLFLRQHAWLLQFYSAYCGHCIAFSPLFKEFAVNISDWGHSIKPAVVNCADIRNTGLCRQYEVLGYPTLTLLPAMVAKEDIGSQMGYSARTIPGMRQAIITYLTAQQSAGNGTTSWVNLLPFSGNASELFNDVPSNVTQAVVIVDSEDSFTAKEALMELGHYRNNVVLRWMVNGTGLIHDIILPSLPAVVVVQRANAVVQQLPDRHNTAVGLRTAVVKHLQLPINLLPSYAISIAAETDTAEGLGAGDGEHDSDFVDLHKLNYDDAEPDSFYDPVNRNKVHLVDVENALGITFRQEVALHKTFSGEALQALKNYLSVLVKYLPARPKVHGFLSDLSKSVSKFRSSMSNSEYTEALDKASQYGVLPEQQGWLGCRGSQPHLRGFPCGLWTTFHMLTVNALDKQQKNPQETLRAIHGFVKHFFSCTHCSQHFQEMYAEDAESYVTNISDLILWFWKSHNKVNRRLAGDATEDPEHPKIQFPPKSLCPKCWKQGSPTKPFKLNEIIKFLKNFYSKDALSLRNIVRSGPGRQGGKSDVVRLTDDGYSNDELYNEKSVFSGLSEISTCLILYSSTTVVLAAIYAAVIVRRRIRRKRFIELYKNP